MSDYQTLQADIASWLARDDLSGAIPTFVRLCEAKVQRDVRVQAQMRRARAEGNGTQYMPLPLNWLEMRRMSLISTSGELTDLAQVAPAAFQPRGGGGDPQTYCVHREIELDAPLPAERDLQMVYYEAFGPLLNPTDTHWLLSNAFDIYLYGSLLEAEAFLRNDERVPQWAAGYTAAVSAVMRSEMDGRVNKGGQSFSMRAVSTP